jgi:hypothetical protein
VLVLVLVLVLARVRVRVRVRVQMLARVPGQMLAWMQRLMQQRVQQRMPAPHLIPPELWNSRPALKIERHPLLRLRRKKRAIQRCRPPRGLRYKLA